MANWRNSSVLTRLRYPVLLGGFLVFNYVYLYKNFKFNYSKEIEEGSKRVNPEAQPKDAARLMEMHARVASVKDSRS